MKILVVGKGASEHALIWKLQRSKHVEKIYCSPGNAGIAEIAECIEINPPDIESYLDFIKYEWIDLVIVNDTEMILNGLVDAIEREGIKVIGLKKSASRLKYKRSYINDLLKLSGLLLPQYKVVTSYVQAQEYIRMMGVPIVLKKDNITDDEDVFVFYTIEDAMNSLKKIMKGEGVKTYSEKILIEEFIQGERISFVGFTDGKCISTLIALYKYMFSEDGEKGSYTSGMGAYSTPSLSRYNDKFYENIEHLLLRAFNIEDVNFKGIFSLDLIFKGDLTYISDLKCYLGEPEIQTVIPLLNTDLSEILLLISEGRLSEIDVVWEKLSSVCIVITKKGFNKKSGDILKINGLDRIKKFKNVYLFHNGTLFSDDEMIITDDKFLSLIKVADKLEYARVEAYKAINELSFDGIYFRRDIGLV